MSLTAHGSGQDTPPWKWIVICLFLLVLSILVNYHLIFEK